MSAGLPDGRNMWIRAFYGFRPEKDGYIGWTNESGQTRALRVLRLRRLPPGKLPVALRGRWLGRRHDGRGLPTPVEQGSCSGPA